MKKIPLIIASTLLATGLSFAQVHIGGHAAVNFSTLWGDGASNMEIPWSLGVTAGAAAKIAVNEKFTVVPELDLDLRRQTDDVITWTTWAIDIPVLVRFNAMPQLFFEAGPQFDLLLSSKIERDLDPAPETINLGDSKALKTFEIGIDVGAGYSVTQNLDLNVRFAVGLTSIVDGTKFDGDDEAFRNMQIQVGGTYWFM